jgi:hypothetical protein
LNIFLALYKDIKERFWYQNGKVFCYKTGRQVGFLNKGYRYIKYGRKAIAEHQIVWCLVHGELPLAQVDHINGDKSDNRIENLRLVTTQQNSFNRPAQKNSQSKYKGVYWEKDRKVWAVRIGLHSACVAVGRFESEFLAALAYDRAIREWAGEYAYQNFGSIV